MAGFHYTETFPGRLDTMNGESSRSSLRALEVFEAFREARRPLSLSEVARMTDMMMTGRVHDAASGLAIGLSQYVVDEGRHIDEALELARKIATNAPMSNYAVMHALPRIADQSQSEGLMTESLMAAIAQSDPAAKQRMDDFLAGRAGKVGKS